MASTDVPELRVRWITPRVSYATRRRTQASRAEALAQTLSQSHSQSHSQAAADQGLTAAQADDAWAQPAAAQGHSDARVDDGRARSHARARAPAPSPARAPGPRRRRPGNVAATGAGVTSHRVTGEGNAGASDSHAVSRSSGAPSAWSPVVPRAALQRGASRAGQSVSNTDAFASDDDADDADDAPQEFAPVRLRRMPEQPTASRRAPAPLSGSRSNSAFAGEQQRRGTPSINGTGELRHRALALQTSDSEDSEVDARPPPPFLTAAASSSSASSSVHGAEEEATTDTASSVRSGEHGITCQICLDEPSVDEAHMLSSCGHAFCTACIRTWVASNVAEAKTVNIACPFDGDRAGEGATGMCKIPIGAADIHTLLEEDQVRLSAGARA